MSETAFGCVKNTIRLRSGSYFDFLDPQPDQFALEDIADTHLRALIEDALALRELREKLEAEADRLKAQAVAYRSRDVPFEPLAGHVHQFQVAMFKAKAELCEGFAAQLRAMLGDR